MNKNEQRIRELAYDIWVSEGRPHGEDERHWEMARKLAEAESGKPTEKPAGRARKTATKPTDATPAAKPAKAVKTTTDAKEAKDVKDPKDVKPAKAAAAAKGNARPKAKAGTDAAEGTPVGVKKTRAPRTKKET
jgi:sRNA-binding protein